LYVQYNCGIRGNVDPTDREADTSTNSAALMILLRMWLVFISSAFSILFLIKRPQGEIGFKYSDIVLKADTYVYDVYEHIGLILLAVTLMTFAKNYRWFFVLFVIIQIVDFGLFLLFYKSPWILGVPWNAWKNIILGLPLAYVSIFRNGDSN
jgi:hypothetical protein